MKKVFLGMKMSYFVFRLKSHLFRCKGRDLERAIWESDVFRSPNRRRDLPQRKMEVKKVLR